jgi:hypothetical protein
MYRTYRIPHQTIVSGPKNRIWICDVSGSMTPHIRAMSDDLIGQLSHCDPQDVLTVLWFSSEGMHGTIVKGMRIGADKQVITQLIRQQMYARNLTCFSESLQDAGQVTRDLAVYNLPFSVMLFSDGYPVVSSYSREIEAIFKAIKGLAPNIADATIIGYGDWYNKQLLAQMAGALGGVVVHADDLLDFSGSMTAHIRSLSNPRVSVRVRTTADGHPLLTFALEEESDGTGKVVLVSVDSEDNAWVSPTVEEVYAIYNENVAELATNEMIAYAVATLWGREGKVDKAMELLAALGDVALVNRLANAFTNTEVGLTVNLIERAVFSLAFRYTEGKVKNCLPKRDAFCLIEALELLEADNEARFYPDAGFEYKRTGVATVAKTGYPKFEKAAQQSVPIDLVWHGSRLNVALRVKYEGTVELDSDASLLGLANPFTCVRFNNYVVVKDGVLNVKVLPISMSQATFETCKKGKLIRKGEVWAKGRVFNLELGRIPIMNRAMADGLNAKELVDAAHGELELEATQKVLKWIRTQLDPEKQEVETVFTPEQRTYLEKFGISYQGWYSPPVEKAEATDWYDARTFEIKIAGASSLPKVTEVVERAKTGKKLNAAQQVTWEAYQNFEATYQAHDLRTVDTALNNVKKQLALVRRQINRARAAIVLGRRWLPEFKSLDENVLEQDGVKYTFALGSEKVEY